MRRAAFGIPLLLLLLLSGFLWQGLRQSMPVSPVGVQTGAPLPQFSLPDLYSGRIMRNADLPAGPFLLNVWASWCPGCVFEHGLLEEAARRGAVLVGLNWRDSPEDARDWLQQWGDPFVQHLSDPGGRLAIDLGVSGAPETFVVDGAGTVLDHHLGVLNEQVLEELLALLERAR